MNWYLVLFGFIGILVVFLAEVYKTTYKKMQWPTAAIRYGLAILLLLCVVHWREAKQVQSFLTFAGVGFLTVLINKISTKLK